ncbi:MAG: PilZ domain-containing protein [Planctomycetales bacterium]|nr:PilZ domain-containing protein [Planctomycetales bacterium]
MFDDPPVEDLFSASGALDAIAELEKNTNAAILAQRASERLEVRTKVWVKPANASQRHQFSIEGVTADISTGGCMMLLPRPIFPGDIFWLSFMEAELGLGSIFARCLRCRFVREEIYEAGFRFLSNVNLTSAVQAHTMLPN